MSLQIFKKNTELQIVDSEDMAPMILALEKRLVPEDL